MKKIKEYIEKLKDFGYLSSYLLNAIFSEIEKVIVFYEEYLRNLKKQSDKLRGIKQLIATVFYEIDKLLNSFQEKSYALPHPVSKKAIVKNGPTIELKPQAEIIISPSNILSNKFPLGENIIWSEDKLINLSIKNKPFKCYAYSKFETDDIYYELVYTFNNQKINRIYIKNESFRIVELYVNDNYITTKKGINITFFIPDVSINEIKLRFKTFPYKGKFTPILDEEYIVSRYVKNKPVPVIDEFINEDCYIYDFSINYIQFFYNYIIDHAEGEIVFEITPRKEKMEIKGTYNDPEYSFVEAYVEYDNKRYYIPFNNYIGRILNSDNLIKVYNFYRKEIMGINERYENCTVKNKFYLEIDSKPLIF